MKRHSTKGNRAGFTLVELLVVIMIIALLGSMSVVVSRVAIESAKRTRTQMTIAKIDSVLSTMYEKYQYQQVDISNHLEKSFSVTNDGRWIYKFYDYPNNILWNNYKTKYYNGTWTRDAIRANQRIVPALWRLHVLRDTVRLEMPCWAGDVYVPSAAAASAAILPNGNVDTSRRSTALMKTYQQALIRATNAAPADCLTWNAAQHALFNSELLYLVVMNGTPDARSMFSDKEIADVNGNGLFEFVDGWGQPIHWLRWAPGVGEIRSFITAMITSSSTPLTTADITELNTFLYGDSANNVPQINTDSDRQLIGNDPKSIDATIQTQLDSVELVRSDDDPLDPLGIDDLCSMISNNRLDSHSWFLVPYVFSAGPDGETGINPGIYEYSANTTYAANPPVLSTLYPFQYNMNCGRLEVVNGQLTNYHLDNIHNHKIRR